jgi:hypothetical protein
MEEQMAQIEFEYTDANGTTKKIRGEFSAQELREVMMKGSEATIVGTLEPRAISSSSISSSYESRVLKFRTIDSPKIPKEPIRESEDLDLKEQLALSAFRDSSSMLEIVANDLEREVADDLAENNADLAQIRETRERIQKNIDEIDAWLSRRAG